MRLLETFSGRVAMTLSARGVAIGVALVSSIITSRWLGPEGRGMLGNTLWLGIALGIVSGSIDLAAASARPYEEST